ncbi:MAG TPA: TMEM165/GDT1 family protein [Candidatus Limnocylindria bacterium]|nr:TMEM165/GDT1 family protein [Candidatus Limnocylindria bacterium]
MLGVDAFAVAFGVVIVAELGDKSQLLTLSFAARYPAWLVLAGVTIAALLMLGLAVLAGSMFALVLPIAVVQVAAGIAFLAFGIWTLRGDDDEQLAGAAQVRGVARALLTVAGAFLIAEFGDKTMLATLTLAATADPLGTWLGAGAGMVGANVAAIVVGALLGARLPRRPIRILAALAFLVVGALLIAEGAALI